MAILNFNARNVDPAVGLDPLPEGWYNAKIIKSEMKPTNAGDGAYLSLAFSVLDGAFAGRQIYTNLNLENKNPIAVEIAQKDLSALAWVTGVIDVQDSQQLHEIPLQIKLSVKGAGITRDGKSFDAGNEIKGYRDIHGRSAKDLAGTMSSAPVAGRAAPVAPTAPASVAPAAPVAPTTPPAGPTRPTNPAHIHAAGTPGEMWWNGTAWEAAPVQPAQAAPAPPAAPAAPTAATSDVPAWAKPPA